MRGTVKRLIERGARTTPGKRFSEVAAWPAAVTGFEDLAFMFTSSQLNHGVASLRFDEAAFLYGLVRGLGRARIVEIGRFKGGSTFIMAAAMQPGSRIVSYDLHVPLRDDLKGSGLDRELVDALERYDMVAGVELVVADSTLVELQSPGLDLLFVDGDHSYEGAIRDIERWSPRVRPGGHLVLHDAVDTGGYGNVYPGTTRAVAEFLERGDFVRARDEGTMAHLVRQA